MDEVTLYDDTSKLQDQTASNEEEEKLEHELNETRYAKIMEENPISPLLGLFNASLKEDTRLFLPRVLYATFGTIRRIPHALLMKAGQEREHYIFGTLRKWAQSVCKIGQIKLDIIGKEKVKPDRTYLFVSNHLSPADIPVLYASLPIKAGFVANGYFTHIPIFSYWMRASGAVFVDQGNQKSEATAFKSMVRRLKRGRSLILFPEGHIHQGKGVDVFKRGGIHSAILAGVPIVPVCLFGTEKVIRAGSLHITPRRKIVVEFGEPVEVGKLGRNEKKHIDDFLHDEIARMKAKHAGNGSDARVRPEQPRPDSPMAGRSSTAP